MTRAASAPRSRVEASSRVRACSHHVSIISPAGGSVAELGGCAPDPVAELRQVHGQQVVEALDAGLDEQLVLVLAEPGEVQHQRLVAPGGDLLERPPTWSARYWRRVGVSETSSRIPVVNTPCFSRRARYTGSMRVSSVIGGTGAMASSREVVVDQPS